MKMFLLGVLTMYFIFTLILAWMENQDIITVWEDLVAWILWWWYLIPFGLFYLIKLLKKYLTNKK